MIEFRHVYFHYGTEDDQHTSELNDINLRIEDGELILITGPSGCGKTTLLRLINGLIPRFYQGNVKGDILLNGRSFKNNELYDLARVVGTVFQNPKSQFYNVDTTSELAFACENQGLPKSDIYQRIDTTVADLHMENLMDRNIFHLSDGEKQKIACASIEVAGLNIILLDEPSANLDYDSTLMLKKLILHWKKQGRTIVVAEHRIAYLWDIMDRLVVMKQGEIVKDIKSEQKNTLNDLDLQKMGLRTRLMESPIQINKMPSVTQDDQIIALKNFNFAYHDVKKKIVNIKSLAIARNQITAIVGKNGAGKTSFLNCFCGLEKSCKGIFKYEDRIVSNRERKKLCFMVMQNTGNQLFTESVLDEVLISLPKRSKNKNDVAMNILRQFDLDFLAHRHPQSLSGGQKQRLAIACALATGRKILTLDEPTSGLDYAHMQELAQLLSKLKSMNTTIVVVTHDSELIHACCTRLIHM
ncbi:ABC transporter ATP-binding protein [Fannyhessea vaginae]|uniref:ABC transporter ATP-binding protein n=1 Tax=Actinomycetota TaxID=201174 RepID=UPI00061D6374|nr:ABC transporter ATP-binding protein [Gardnerella swidsinskii]NSX39496.1 ABC transporter ATP-binding protein [Gardnerella vaginalis]CRH85422.1 ABC transporter%2C ATP-binding component [Chlamydia trachomatis]